MDNLPDRAEILVWVTQAREGNVESQRLAEDALARVIDHEGTVPRACAVLRLAASTVYRWCAPSGPLSDLGDLLRERGMCTVYHKPGYGHVRGQSSKVTR